MKVHKGAAQKYPRTCCDLASVIRKFLVTEKSTLGTQDNRYTFEVHKAATKPQIARAVQRFFGVEVKRVNTLCVKGKVKRFRGRLGARPDRKKAMVFLKEGQTIDMEAKV